MSHLGRLEVAPPGPEQSLGELVSAATKDLSDLLRMEVELAKVEVKKDLQHTVKGAAGLIAAGLMGFFVIAFFSVFAALGIGFYVGNLWGFLCMAAFWGILAGGAGLIGLRSMKRIGPPERTIRTLKDTADWARHPTVAPTVKVDTLGRS